MGGKCPAMPDQRNGDSMVSALTHLNILGVGAGSRGRSKKESALHKPENGSEILWKKTNQGAARGGCGTCKSLWVGDLAGMCHHTGTDFHFHIFLV